MMASGEVVHFDPSMNLYVKVTMLPFRTRTFAVSSKVLERFMLPCFAASLRGGKLFQNALPELPKAKKSLFGLNLEWKRCSALLFPCC